MSKVSATSGSQFPHLLAQLPCRPGSSGRQSPAHALSRHQRASSPSRPEAGRAQLALLLQGARPTVLGGHLPGLSSGSRGLRGRPILGQGRLGLAQKISVERKGFQAGGGRCAGRV